MTFISINGQKLVSVDERTWTGLPNTYSLYIKSDDMSLFLSFETLADICKFAGDINASLAEYVLNSMEGN